MSQETLAQRNALLERLLAMQQQAAAQVPTPTGTRAAIEGQQDAWWLDKQMKVTETMFPRMQESVRPHVRGNDCRELRQWQLGCLRMWCFESQTTPASSVG
jgi:hypothetical protein